MEMSRAPSASHLVLNFLNNTPIDVKTFAQIEFHRLDENLGFNFLPRSDDVFQIHIGSDIKATLGDDWTFIQMHGDEVCCDTDDFNTSFVSLAISLRSWETWKQGRLDIDDF